MTDNHQERAQRVVRAFKAMLEDRALEHITNAQFEDLALMIHKLVTEELEGAVAVVEDALNRVRGGIAKPDLGL